MLKKWKWIRFELSNAGSWYFHWIESKTTILKQLEFQLSTQLVFHWIESEDVKQRHSM